MEAWSPPDPGMHQSGYSDPELEKDEVNLDETSCRSLQEDPFFHDEAVQTSRKHQMQVNLHTRMTKI